MRVCLWLLGYAQTRLGGISQFTPRYIFLLDDLRSLIFQDHRIVLGAGTALDHHASRPDHPEVPDLVWR